MIYTNEIEIYFRTIKNGKILFSDDNYMYSWVSVPAGSQLIKVGKLDLFDQTMHYADSVKINSAMLRGASCSAMYAVNAFKSGRFNVSPKEYYAYSDKYNKALHLAKKDIDNNIPIPGFIFFCKETKNPFFWVSKYDIEELT